MSSAVLATTTRSSPATSSMPRARRAPPVPPARTTTGPSPATALLRQRVGLAGQAGDADAGAGLVAGVDPDEQRGERLHDPGLLEPARVHAAQPLDALDDRGGLALVGPLVAAEQHVLVEGVVEVAEEVGRDRVQRGDDP